MNWSVGIDSEDEKKAILSLYDYKNSFLGSCVLGVGVKFIKFKI